VSGIVLLARSKDFAKRFEAKMRTRDIRKHYLARVCGRFAPSASKAVTVDELDHHADGEAHNREHVKVVCQAPITMGNFKDGLSSVDFANGKAAKTEFELQFYDQATDSSVLLCMCVRVAM
jgi:23S rRNA-/tRNA-specific pseudouridylate synthase